jgi:hypothetical protein
MKRCSCILLILAACVCGEGCRRGRSTPRDPVTTKVETDLMMSKAEKSLVFALRPNDRKIKIYMENLKNVEAELKAMNDPEKAKDRLAKLVASQEELQKSDAGKEQASKLEEAMDKQGAMNEFNEFALASIDFYQKTKPNGYTVDNFYSFVRRAKLIVPRRYVDKVAREIAIDEYPMYKFLDDKKANIAIFVDKNNGNHLAAYDDDGQFVMKNDKMQQPIKMPKERVKLELDMQELQVLRLNYLAYIYPHYALNADAGLPGFQGNPAGHLLAQRANQLRNPPERFDLDNFKKYLKDNAPPALMQDIEDAVIIVSATANPRNGADPIASRSEFEIDTVDKQKIPRGHRTIYMSGVVGYAFPQFLPYQFPPPKKDP